MALVYFGLGRYTFIQQGKRWKGDFYGFPILDKAYYSCKYFIICLTAGKKNSWLFSKKTGSNYH